jgi:hypothetical protein
MDLLWLDLALVIQSVNNEFRIRVNTHAGSHMHGTTRDLFRGHVFHTHERSSGRCQRIIIKRSDGRKLVDNLCELFLLATRERTKSIGAPTSNRDYPITHLEDITVSSNLERNIFICHN